MVTKKPTSAKHVQGRPRAFSDAHEPVIHYVARNRRARHDYDILDVYECGIALKGAEVKSLRLGQASLQDAYARIDNGEMWLVGAHLAPYEYGSGYGRFEPLRPRKLLLHRQQIDELSGQRRPEVAHPGPAQHLLQRRPCQGRDRPGQGTPALRQAPRHSRA